MGSSVLALSSRAGSLGLCKGGSMWTAASSAVTMRTAFLSSRILSASAMAALTSLESALRPMSIPSSDSSSIRSATMPALLDGSSVAISDRYGRMSLSARDTVVCMASAVLSPRDALVPRTPRLRDMRDMYAGNLILSLPVLLVILAVFSPNDM